MEENIKGLWKYEKEKAREIKQKKRPNAFHWFTLGFVTCTILVQILLLIKD